MKIKELYVIPWTHSTNLQGALLQYVVITLTFDFLTSYRISLVNEIFYKHTLNETVLML